MLIWMLLSIPLNIGLILSAAIETWIWRSLRNSSPYFYVTFALGLAAIIYYNVEMWQVIGTIYHLNEDLSEAEMEAPTESYLLQIVYGILFVLLGIGFVLTNFFSCLLFGISFALLGDMRNRRINRTRNRKRAREENASILDRMQKMAKDLMIDSEMDCCICYEPFD